MNEVIAPVDGLDADMAGVLADLRSQPPPTDTDPIAAARAGANQFLRWSRPAVPVAEVQDISVPGARRPIPVRLYRAQREPAPLAFFIHGGAWCAGSIELSDRTCRRLCNGSDRVVASVGYGLAPEEPYPDGLDDCLFAWSWLQGHGREFGITPHDAAVVGESAGANLAAASCLRMRDDGDRSATRQVLICPVLDTSTGTTSHRRWGGGSYLVSTAGLAESWQTYLSGSEVTPYAAPLRSQDLRRLPDALVVVAECDPLRDDGIEYARKLQAADVSTTVITAPGLLHAFAFMDGVSTVAAATVDRIAAELRTASREARSGP